MMTRRWIPYALTVAAFVYLSYNTFVADPVCEGLRCGPRSPSLYPVIRWVDDHVRVEHVRLLLSLYQSDRTGVQ
jgi:hypothetical protein